jgi:hypothetical protein
MGIISWTGQFGPDNTGRLPFWWDMVVVAVFSLIIYYWAQATRLSTEEVSALVEKQIADQNDDAATV